MSRRLKTGQTKLKFVTDFWFSLAESVKLLDSSMAISLSSQAKVSLKGESSKPSAYWLKRSSSFYSVRFPARFSGIQTKISSPSTPRYVPFAIEAKKQTYDSFDDLLVNSDKPVLVDFYATWCGPCQFMVPILNEVGSTLKDKIQVVKIDTEKYPTIANKYRIEALPTFILFKDAKPCDRFEGALTAAQLIQRIEKSLEVKQ